MQANQSSYHSLAMEAKSLASKLTIFEAGRKISGPFCSQEHGHFERFVKVREVKVVVP